MPQRQTLLARPSDVPRVAPSRIDLAAGSFGVAPTADASGLINLGRGLESASSDVADYQLRLKREQEHRQDQDAALEARVLMGEAAKAARERVIKEQSAWEADQIANNTNAIVKEEFDRVNETLSQKRSSSPGFKRAVTDNFVRASWLNETEQIVLNGYNTEAVATQASRDENFVRLTQNETNKAGTNLAAVADVLSRATADVKDQPRYSRNLKESFLPKVVQPLAISSLKAAVTQRKAWTPDIAAAADSFHKKNWITTEDMLALKSHAEGTVQQDRAETNAALDRIVADLKAGSGRMSPQEIHQLSDTVHKPGSVQANDLAAKLTAARAVGVAQSRWDQGEFALPIPQLDRAIEMLSNGNDLETRSVMIHFLPDSQKDIESYSPEIVRKFGTEMLDLLKRQRATPVNQIAEKNPVVATAMFENGSPENAITTYDAFYDKNGIPAERRIYFHRPHAAPLIQLLKEGKREEAVQELEKLAIGYGTKGRFAIARGLAADETTRPYAGIAAVLAQVPMTEDRSAQNSIREFARTLAWAHSVDTSKVTDLATVKDNLSKVMGSAVVTPVGKTADAGDQTYGNVIAALQSQSPEAAYTLDDSLKKLVIAKAYGPDGSQRPLDEMQRTMNSLGGAFMVVRMNGTHSEQPVFSLHVPDAAQQDWLTRTFSGDQAGFARSIQHQAYRMSIAYDAPFVNGLDQVKYRGWFGQNSIMAQGDNQLALNFARYLPAINYRPNGIENRSLSTWNLLHPNDKNMQLPEDLKIPFDNVVLSDGKPVARSPLRIAGTNIIEAERYVQEELIKSPGMDERSNNQLILAKHGRWVEIPGGKVQLFLTPSAPQVGNVPGGTVGEPTPVYTIGKSGKPEPIIKETRAFKIYMDRFLSPDTKPKLSAFLPPVSPIK